MAEQEVGEDPVLQGQADVWRFMFGFVDSMALKCVVELSIPDIINSHGFPISLTKIIQAINTPSPDITYLSRIMRLLVRKRVFTAQDNGDETLYGLTESSKWLLRDTDFTLAPMVLAENHPMLLAPWHYLSKCVEEGGIAFKKAHGADIWELATSNAEINKVFNDGMGCTNKITVKAILDVYKDAFEGMRSIVDVGGGIGTMMKDIVHGHPSIKGVNFDLPHVVATAPQYPGVEHVGGDMFVAIPKADAVIMKWIMHDWSDEDCVKILKNCHKAIPKKNGKVIIVDNVLRPDGKDLFDDTRLAFDLLMIAHSSGGKERTEIEWKKILKDGGFPGYKIIQIPALPSIIEAYPE